MLYVKTLFVLFLITKFSVLHVMNILSGIENQGTDKFISLRSEKGEDKSVEACELVTLAWQSCDEAR